MFMKSMIALAAGALMATAASAGVTVVTGTTAGGPTYNRVIADTPPIALSNVGTAVRYDPISFTVSTDGDYTLLLESTYDNFLSIYVGSFDPANPLANIDSADDDTVGFNARLTRNLLAGTSYIAVATSFDNADSGAYTLTFRGPGDITVGGVVPEPATWAMLIAGFGAVGMAARRRRTVAVAA